MTIWEALLLGLVQGLTEFLPVSSSGHLVLIQEIFGIEVDGLMFFNVMLHLATLVAVVFVLAKEIWALVYPKPSKQILYLIVATIPAVIVGFALGDLIEGFFASARYLCFFFLVTAILLLVTEYVGKRRERKLNEKSNNNEKSNTNDNCQGEREITLKTSVFMGLMQGAAVFPGISRSGSTISAGVFSGAGRSKVARFSFLMSIPIILGSTLMESIKIDSIDIGAAPLIVGMLAAAVSGFLAIKLMLRIINKCNYKWFSLYLVILAIVVFANYYVHPIW